MGTWASSPAQFIAATKAKASEVNSKFTDVYSALTGGTYDHYLNAIINRRLDAGSVDITSSACYFNGYFAIDSTTTYKLKASSSRMVIFGELEIKSGGLVDMTSGSVLHIP